MKLTIKKRVFATVTALLVLTLVPPSHAQQLFGSTSLDPSFCQDKTFRQTVIYVDNMSIQRGQTQWAIDLESKLKASLTPGEKVSVVELSPSQGASQELWSGCYPDYTQDQRQNISKKTYFFTENPLDGLKTQQGFFMNAVGQSITKIYQDAAKLPRAGHVDSSQPPTAEIVEALASDGARFSQSHQIVRALVYTNGAQNSPLGNVFSKPATPPGDIGQRQGTYFRHSIFYFFGIGNGVSGDDTYEADAKNYWTNALGSMDAPIGGFSSDITVTNEIPIADYAYDIKISIQNNELFGKIYFLVDADSNLIDGWIGVSRLGLVGITGTFICAGSNASNCSLTADTIGGLTTKSSTETLTLTGDTMALLKGSEGIQGAMIFPITASAKSN